ncbi:MAG: hypothetical protein KC435_14435, partial [Thermomicrobiales bacterium]|nr:hypothetical protein [Thermomicrobiales bacterium]
MTKRLRTFLAIAVTLMMLVQSVSSTAFAQEIVGTPVVENTDNSGDNTGDTPDEGTPVDTEDQTDEQQPVESENNQVQPMAVISGAITSLNVTTSSGGTTLGYWDTVTVSGTFTLPAGSNTGDTFTLQAPAELNVPSGLSKTLDGGQVQMTTGAGGLITFTLLEDITTTVTNGVFYLESTAQRDQIEWESEVTFVFSGSVAGGTTTEFTFQTGPEPGPQPIPTNPYKWSWNNPANGTLTFHIGTGAAASDGSFTIVDSANGWDYDCDASRLYYGSSYTNDSLNVDGSRALTDAECGEDFINVSGTVATNGGAYVLAVTKPVAGGYTFTNTATVTMPGKEPQEVRTAVDSYDFGGGSSGPISPVTPTWSAQTCDGGTWIAPVVSPADGTITDGVLYSNGSATLNGNVIEIRLTAQRGTAQTWEDLGEGWSATDDPRVINFYTEIDYIPCDMEEVDLQLPTVEAYVCEGGVDPNPTVN